MKGNRWIIGLLLAALLAAFAAPASAQEHDMNPRTITVRGAATVMGEPNIARVELGVELVDANLGTAFSSAAETANNVIDALRGVGIPAEDIQTSSVNVFPEERYDPLRGSTGERVFRVRYIVIVTVRDTSLIEAVINSAINAGANTIYNLNFGIDDASALEAEARAAAVQNARDKAQQIADALGVSLGAPVRVNEYSGQDVPIPLARGMGGMMDSVAALPISQGQLGVIVQVEVTFAIGE